VAEKDMHYFRQIERFLGKEIPKEVMPEELGETPTYRSNMSGGKKHHSQGKQAEKGKGGDKSKKRRYYHNKKKQKKEGNK
jgi:superfamily II DNA/RNA helicase